MTKRPDEKVDLIKLRDLFVLTWDKLGKSKDDLVKSFGREIGQAMAAVVKEPLEMLTKTNKLQITIELVPKEEPRKRSPRKLPDKNNTGNKT